MKRLGLVKAGALEPFVRFLRANDVNLTPHFLNANIPPDLITRNDSWLPKQQVYTFLSDVAAAHDMEALGLIVGDQICVADLGDLGKEIYKCKGLEGACNQFAALVPKLAEGNTAAVTTSGGATWFTYQTTDHRRGNRDYADHYGMMMLLSVVRLVAGHWYPKEVKIQTGACDAFDQHPAWKDTRVEFDADATGIAFPAKWLCRPVPKPPTELKSTSGQDGYASNPPETLARSLEIVLAAYLNLGGLPSLDMVAESLNMSTRTLKRRLSEEGETYSALTDRIRIRVGEKLLQGPEHSVTEVAFILGYSGPTTTSGAKGVSV